MALPTGESHVDGIIDKYRTTYALKGLRRIISDFELLPLELTLQINNLLRGIDQVNLKRSSALLWRRIPFKFVLTWKQIIEVHSHLITDRKVTHEERLEMEWWKDCAQDMAKIKDLRKDILRRWEDFDKRAEDNWVMFDFSEHERHRETYRWKDRQIQCLRSLARTEEIIGKERIRAREAAERPRMSIKLSRLVEEH